MHDAAQFYWGKPEAWLKNKRLFDRHSLPLKITSSRVRDIDTEDDWMYAEMMFNHIKKGHNDKNI